MSKKISSATQKLNKKKENINLESISHNKITNNPFLAHINSNANKNTNNINANFNVEKTKNQMKEMIRLSIKTNIIEPEDSLSTDINLNSNELSKLKKFNNTLDIHKDKINELINLRVNEEKLNQQQNIILKAMAEENSDTLKLIEYYKKQIEVEKKIYEDLDNEEKKVKYREELLIDEAKTELDANLVSIHHIKDTCLNLESIYTNSDYKLSSLKQRSEEILHKIEYNSIELDEKIKFKLFKQNEFNKKNQEIGDTKLRIEAIYKIHAEYIEYLRFLHNDLQESKGNIRVFCRVRPLLPKEQSYTQETNNTTFIEYPNQNTIILNGPMMKSNVGKKQDTQIREQYRFDRVFRPEDSQDEIFKEISQLVQSALDGYKVCIFAYGQTGSGKTYTMEGEEDEKRGIIPRSMEKIFDIKSVLENNGWKFNIEVSCYEIYMDQVRDLLMTNSNNIIPQNSISSKIDKFTVIEVTNVEDIHKILDISSQKRAVAETLCNEKSSRSHCIFQLRITGKNIITKQERLGALNLIDLAGSERISNSKVEGERLKETISINKSLTSLKSVITALVTANSKSNTHIPFRDSILTHLLQGYLGGDSKTLMFANISPLISNHSETSCSLKFASDVNSCYVKSSEDK